MSEFNNTSYTLIHRIKDRYDEAAWEEFVEIYRRYIYMVIRHMEIDMDTTEELTQSILIKLWQKLPEINFIQGNAKFRTWLSKVIYNSVVDHQRSVKRSPNLTELNETHGIDSQINKMMDTEWENYIANLALERVKTSFSGKAIEVFEMTRTGKSLEEISIKLDIKQDSVYRLKNRVIGRLKREVNLLRHDLG